MSADAKPRLDLEIGHVLFIDIIGYSKLLIDDQRELQERLNQIVRDTKQFRAAESAGKLVRLPTGDGIALVFFTSPEAPVECALEISEALQSHPQLRLRMGINTGPVSGVADVNDRSNIAGAGINLAQRVMDIGDAGHILLSKRAAEDLAQYRHWEPHLHELGEWEVKHGVRISLVNLYTEKLGNSQLPEKLKQQTRQRVAHRRRRRTLIAGLVLLAVAFPAGALIYLRQPPSKSSNKSTASPLEKSIAVLPFENRSEDKANAYFADGIQDEILTRLSKIADLKVISRTSTEKYRKRPDNLKIIADELDVAALLEGSVQKVGGKVHVVVQLIEAKSDRHLWAESYDRSLEDIFAVQSEIAGQVASALHARLTPQESVALNNVPTRNQKAYDLFLQAEYSFRIGRKNYSSANVLEAIGLYRQAVAEDAGFALAYARLSIAESNLEWEGERPIDTTPDQARIDAEKALSLQPDLMQAHLALAYVDYWGRLDYPNALKHFTRAQALAPKNAEVLSALGEVYQRQLRFEDAIPLFERAAQYDPGNSQLFSDLALAYWEGRRTEKVQPAFERALALDPDNDGTASQLAQFLIVQRGDVEGARKVLRRRGQGWQFQLAGTYCLTRDYETAIRLMEELPADPAEYGSVDRSRDEILGDYLHRAGHDERALPLLERARAQRIALLADKTLSPRRAAFASLRLAETELALGNRDAAVQVAERGAQLDAVTRDPFFLTYYRGFLAKIYAEVDRKDEAIALISELLKPGSGTLRITPHTLRLAPDWDPLRDNPRFQALLEEYPLDPHSH